MADSTQPDREHGRRRDSRSRSPRRHHSHSHRRRSSHSNHHRSKRPTEAVPELPYNCRPITKNDYETFKPMFASYLDIQKGIFLDELGETEVKGRWKSFLGKWNRGELSEGWYDPSTLRKAQESAREYEEEIARESNPVQSNEPPSTSSQREPEQKNHGAEDDGDDSDDSMGPTLPGEIDKSRRNRSGPNIPNMEDLELRREMALEDGLACRDDIRFERKIDRKQQKEALDELVPRAEAGTRERQLEKKKEVNEKMRSFREKSPGAAEVPDTELMGGDEGIEGFKKKKEEFQRKKNERELRKEEIMRAKQAERDERLQETPSPRQVLDPAPPPPSPPPSAKQHPLRGRKFALIGSSIAALIFAGYSSYLFVLLNKEPIESSSSEVQADVSSRYDTIASKFDSEVDWTEWSMGITKMRKKLAQEAHGDVLEVSIGTGRNLEYYDWDFKGFNGVGKLQKVGGIKKGKVKSFTAVDKSGEMLEVAHEKFSTMFPGVLGVRWIIQDASEKIPGPPRNANETSGNNDAKYDTVIQTMGLCSAADPVRLLKNLGECVKEDEGRILLLEHGRAKWDWLNRALDNSAEGHAKLFGCWWNRDLGKIVEESGLEVVNIKRRHGGTTWRIELKKPKAIPKDSGVEVATEEKTQEATRKRWW
ncbi:hypothetical protein BPOR_0072g00050 [Botrytis porri]|uniref:Methyltransferase type 11 domain-containing protein n=1 Tax=Botrytis porri TaxID=87229 RepID=A0A4Z1L0D0_9HELO|nr:hypothetical protein BPOR_0072g00050 [Botrytis porri]